ncbi:cell wall-binding repeat-containing protein [Desulfosporosinus sp. PR]|uniref:cell wall-binding repeat-containing protein n=1 Tax=Candidatus Desulfosporosinus nitrosoreducens TaxID=3401928 RepID=UPI0027E9A0D9|nr:cell wall-binding repeat-containing protein [Desulfosporosinus sp. PR]MDQ7093191.1 cell wall-binding repeat-containing protein [Desulfosporosinus sp. PR]
MENKEERSEFLMSLRKRSSKLCLILSLITLISLAIPTVTLANSSPTITRLAGIDRYETASQIARSGWSQSDYAILAFGGDYPDALSAAPLAKKFNAPILLTDTGSLPSTTKQTLLDLQVKKVVIIGGTAVISQAVESELQTMGLETTRVYGNDRYATAVQVAQQVNSKPSTLFVVTGEDYPDALSVASIASMKQIPIILVPYDVMPDTVKSYLSTLNVSKTYVVGDSDIISDQVAQQFPNTVRILGADKYARNILINQTFVTDFNSDSICLATGEGFADALAGTAYCAKLSEPITLINNDSPANTRSYYQQRVANASHVYVFGGTGIIPDSVITDLNPSNATNGDSLTKAFKTLRLSNLTKVGATTATFKYQVLDGTGKDITSSVPATQLSAVASVKSSVTLDPSKGIGTITYNSSSDIDKPVIITLVDLTTGIVISLDSSSGSDSSSYTFPVTDPASQVPTPSQTSDQKVSKITITSTKLAIISSDGTDKIGYATYIVNDQYGADITESPLANDIQFKTNVGTITAQHGLIKLEFYPNINPESLTEVTITGVYLNSGVTTNSALDIVPMFGEITN